MERGTDSKRIDEPGDLAGASGGGDPGGRTDRSKKQDDWQQAGTEDPAFFIKLSEAE